jgi:hypothetical protein
MVHLASDPSKMDYTLKVNPAKVNPATGFFIINIKKTSRHLRVGIILRSRFWVPP